MPPLAPALEKVRTAGFAIVPDALGPEWLDRLLAEVQHDEFLPLPDRIGRVRHRVEEAVIPVLRSDGSALGDLAAAMQRAVAAAARPEDGLRSFEVNQAVYLRYRGRAAGIGPHVDGKCYVLLVPVVTLRGSARFSVLGARGGGDASVAHLSPGDLCLLRAPGFGGEADGRPLHAVGPPAGGEERLALTLRMRARMGPGAN